jgi:uncharacterized membrane protein YcaP (DUF421 family)
MWFDLSVYCGKTLVVLLYLFLGFRLLGKRQIAQFNLYDLATLIAIANAVQNAMTHGKGDLAIGLVCSMTLILIGWLITRAVVRLPGTQALIYGTPTILVSEGVAFGERLHKERVTHEELEVALRQHGLTSIAKVKLAVLEVDGAISIVPFR